MLAGAFLLVAAVQMKRHGLTAPYCTTETLYSRKYYKINVVEAVGVEPTSEKDSRKETTCISGSVVFVREV